MKRLVLAAILLADPAGALTLDVPGRPVVKAEKTDPRGAVLLPTAAWNGTEVPGDLMDGQIVTKVLQADIVATPPALLALFSKQLSDAGYDVRLACIDRACGGFDFRFALPIVDPPAMFVDLGNYAFLSATKDDTSAIMVMASQSPNRAHVQITEIIPPGGSGTKVKSATIAPVTRTTNDLAAALEANGFFILSDLKFQVGSSQLDGDDFASLAALAEYLSANPHRTIALVGHTDATGSLAGNIALSKKRAGAVRSLLTRRHNADGKRIAAEGMGYLSPVAPNTTAVGREQNRRVEVIITSDE